MRGGDSLGLRAYNERLIVSAVMRAGPLSKAEIARETGLSGQSASVIVNRLLAEGLLTKRDKVRGQVGQPSTPIAANPEGAYALGVKIGRRSVEAVVVDLVGEVVARDARRHEAPLPAQTMEAAESTARKLLDTLPTRDRVVGLGIAMPDFLESWGSELDLPPGSLAGWSDMDVEGRMAHATGLDVTRYNDATAACAAEMIAGDAITTASALYVYLGTFAGGGVVLDGRLVTGAQRNAGALGSMPVSDDARTQLLHRASVIDLERRLEAAGLDPAHVMSSGTADAGAPFSAWAAEAVPALARSITAARAVIDFEAVVVDGLLPAIWRDRILAQVEAASAACNQTGLAPVAYRPGTIGAGARVLGAALLPLQARFSADTDLLVRHGRADEGAEREIA